MQKHINTLQDVFRKIVKQVMEWYEPRFRRITMSHDTSGNPAELVGRDGTICYRKEGGSCVELGAGSAGWELTDETPWGASTAYVLTDYVAPTTPNTYSYECTTAGTSAGTEPIWPTIAETTVNDGTVVWTCKSVRAKLTEAHDIDMQGEIITTSDGADLTFSVKTGKAFVFVKV